LKFKIDENLPVEIAQLLRNSGYDADTINDEGLSGADDEIDAQRCRSESRILISLDLDFANVRTFPPKDHDGLIVLRAKQQDKDAVITLFRRVLLVLREYSPAGQLWIVEPDRIRRR